MIPLRKRKQVRQVFEWAWDLESELPRGLLPAKPCAKPQDAIKRIPEGTYRGLFIDTVKNGNIQGLRHFALHCVYNPSSPLFFVGSTPFSTGFLQQTISGIGVHAEFAIYHAFTITLYHGLDLQSQMRERPAELFTLIQDQRNAHSWCLREKDLVVNYSPQKRRGAVTKNQFHSLREWWLDNSPPSSALCAKHH